jgi:hypothetical protein
MNGIAAKIAIEIGVFFQDGDIDAGAREKITGHHSGRAAADDKAAVVKSRWCGHDRSL